MSAPDVVPPPERRDLVEVYKTVFETWRSQVESSWQRSTYFAAFEIAAIGGCWLLVSDEKRLLPVAAGIAFSIGGLWLTRIWYKSTTKTQAYVLHWWKGIIEVEKGLSLNTRADAS